MQQQIEMHKECGQLVLQKDPGGYRHYLRGVPVHCGTGLEILIDGHWIAVRYECALSKDNCRPVLYFSEDGRILPGRETTYRWPV